MIKFDLYNILGNKVNDIYLDKNIFDFYIRFKLLSEYIRYYNCKIRRGTHCNKSKAEVSGTNKKPFPQKGRGIARQGSYKNPHQKGGGVAFALKPKNYSYKFGKKKSVLALKNSLGLRIKEKSLLVLEDFNIDKISTKYCIKCINNFNFSKVLIIDKDNIKLNLSVRNSINYKYIDVRGLNVYSVLKFPKILITRDAILYLENKILKRNLMYFKD